MWCSIGAASAIWAAEDGGEADDGGGGFGEALGVVGIVFGGLVDEGAAGGAGGDVGQGVRGVGGVDEVAVEHDVGRRAPREGDVVRGEGAEDGFEVVDVFGEGGVGEGGAEAGGVERDFDGGVVVDGEAEAAGGVGVAGRAKADARAVGGDGAPQLVGGAPKRYMVSAGGRFGLGFGFGVGFGGDLFGDGAGVFEDGDGEAGECECEVMLLARASVRSAAISLAVGLRL